jgi:uncharacterized protein
VFSDQGVTFIWDEAKHTLNVRDHGITFEEAATVFRDPLHQTRFDGAKGQPRHVTLGVSSDGNTLIVVHFEVEEDLVRIISARKADRKERRYYAKHNYHDD